MKPVFLLALISLMGIVFFPGCIPDPVEIDIPQAPSKLVVASQIIPDRFVLVQVSKSFGALEATTDSAGNIPEDLLQRLLVERGRVTLTYRDGTDTLAHLGAGLYLSTDTRLYPGETYSLSVYDSVSKESAFATAEVLPIVPLQDAGYVVEFVPLSMFDTSFVDTVVKFIFELTDPAGDNYYMLNAYKVSGGGGLGNSNPFTQTLQTPTFAFSDRQYLSPVIRDTVRFDQFTVGDTVILALSNISKTYYDFLTIRQRSGNSLFALLLKEPITYPTNVLGGYGVFNLHLPSLVPIVVQ